MDLFSYLMDKWIEAESTDGKTMDGDTVKGAEGFVKFARGYLTKNQPVGTATVGHSFGLVFQDHTQIPLVDNDPDGPDMSQPGNQEAIPLTGTTLRPFEGKTLPATDQGITGAE